MKNFLQKFSFLFFSFLLLSCFNHDDTFYQVRIREIIGTHLKLDSGKVVRLAGVALPSASNPNYDFNLNYALKQELKGKEIYMKTALKHLGDNFSYPRVDLVELYRDGINLNREFLKKGKVFYSFDIFRDHNLYIEDEKIARKQKLGIWKKESNLIPLYLTHKNWRHLHYPEDPKVHDIANKDLIIYYIDPPIIHGGKYLSFRKCEFCSQLEKQKDPPMDLMNPF